MSKLIVLAAFRRDDQTGDLVPAFHPRECPSEDRAKQEARMLSTWHAGVVAWSREAAPDVGDYGPPTVIASYGDIPDME